MNQTPSGERLHITIFGRRNSGKSSLINALTRQKLAIVSDVPGTTTDPVAKAMEILPIGPVVVTDTAGIDDIGDLGKLRVEKTLRVLEKTDLAVLVVVSGTTPGEFEEDLAVKVKERKIPMVVVANKIDIDPDSVAIETWAKSKNLPFVAVSATTAENIEGLKSALISSAPEGFAEPTIIGDLIQPGDIVVLVVPIDKAAPKGRLILPQVMTLRDALDHDAYAVVVKERELKSCLASLNRKPKLVITDSQVFMKVDADTPKDIWMTSFSILMARYKGNLDEFVEGAKALRRLKPGSCILISEGCTHHRQGDDIGTVQIPRWLRQSIGGDLEFGFSSGIDFPPDFNKYDLIIHCGACTLNRREVMYRQQQAKEAGIPMTNYGVVLAYVHGILDRALEPFPLAKLMWEDKDEPASKPKVRVARTIN
ncbi:MAG TPA: [FeFe] hydrogenase H-cluster maturation GTPase HydF [Armatimonadota bacterium]|nr:[FeFe] hydrogenase H-cluster maturation GTPase HydF [Armatimonadota bacterium]HOM71894.1 [FeFe] hydrogenase H-cluster maturation GTPase HydF [Armatimonadota bacterium]HPP74012.1 [FeFe] hydrogenase H-cluster maturation GTPase HydF [Armatimonadota bacterium]